MDFTFNASALGVGGVIERGDVITTIPSLASVALAPTGGEGKSVVSNYFSEEFEFAHAETRVYGRQIVGDDGKPLFTTSTYVLLKNLRIFDRIRIGEMRSTVTSRRGLDGDLDHEFEIMVSYKQVRIGKADVEPRIDKDFLEKVKRYKDLEGLMTPGRSVNAEQTELAGRFNGSPGDLAKLVREKRPVQGSVVAGIDGLVERKLHPSKVTIPGFGTVRFGELMLKPGRRRLNLLRINFGPEKTFGGQLQQEGAMPQAFVMAPGALDEDLFSKDPTGGSMTFGSGEGNGTPIGP
jgi:hypothetical protein